MAQIKANAAQLYSLSHQMDELSARAVTALQQYEDAVQHASSGIFVGSAGTANVATTAQIKQAQINVQNRFKQVNEMLRQAGGNFTNTDDDNHQRIASLPSQLQWT
jgi:WXG100 family type VII secretion target